jgi:hypothetical protein
MKQPTKLYFEALYQANGVLLNQVKKYDRKLRNKEELEHMDITYSGIEFTKSMYGTNRVWMERAVLNLEQMKFRLLTMMEDLLYTA